MSRVLALDFGEARCGCALSDPTGTLATPLEAVERPDTRRGLQRIAQLVRDRSVARVVVGLPLSLSGGEGPQAVRTREWAGRLAARLPGVPVDLHDERLTTRQAERAGGHADEDSRAAAHLLEAYLAAAPAGSGGRQS
ncbi:MAG: putative pre6S rRNA nuclease [Thermoleophilaceae bacterium]|jgi:putative Holliday junction resolvase|nr:putative pre6S rRNA nuclease [Thermoleophilaceae bacterium]